MSLFDAVARTAYSAGLAGRIRKGRPVSQASRATSPSHAPVRDEREEMTSKLPLGSSRVGLKQHHPIPYQRYGGALLTPGTSGPKGQSPKGGHGERMVVNEEGPEYSEYDYQYDDWDQFDNSDNRRTDYHYGDYGLHQRLECCPLVVDPLAVLSLLVAIAFATFFLNQLIQANIGRKRRKRKRRQVGDVIKKVERGTEK